MTPRAPAAPALHLACVLACAAASGLPAPARADTVVDDFSTGLYRSPQIKSGEQRSQQFGSRIVGGSRVVAVSNCATDECAAQNPYQQGLSYAIAKGNGRGSDHPPVFLQNAPVFTGGRFEIDYGAAPASLDLDWSAADRLRFDFLGLTETMNFVILVYDDSGFRYLEGGCNAAPYNGSFTLEVQFDRMAAPGGAIDLHHVTFIEVISQPSSFIGGVEMALARITATSTPVGGALACN